ncbi:uncharacterized protein N7500_002838 [Penicillium coprophilum]|uniref:uncharacterized protein n=1 Tax=Penicillium coprophilum TaxID=36646 RepID=UPI00238F7B06|nr:uncharacterized protein N7500_002838 [Penicillium coprophilum]KAJ5170055.1 hypothetical protein N7500_002838 [Penicillium coprophilum]
MPPLPSAYLHLDTAESQVSHSLREAGVRHDIDIITERDARDVLSEIPELTWSLDEGCWKYSYRNFQASISASTPGGGPWSIPSPRNTGIHTIHPDDVPDRSIYVKIDIIHPSVLILTKLKAWNNAEMSHDPSVHMRNRAHLMDIMSALQWLSDEEMRIKFEGHPGVPKEEFLQLLCKLYRRHHQARPYLSVALSFNDMRDALNSPH